MSRIFDHDPEVGSSVSIPASRNTDLFGEMVDAVSGTVAFKYADIGREVEII